MAPNKLQQLNLSDAQQRAVRAMQELSRGSYPELPRNKLLNPEDIARVYQHRFGGILDQLMIAVAPDADGRFMQQLLIGKYTGHGYGLDPVHVLRPLIRAGAETFVIVQNHPTGRPKPLPDQRFFVEKLARAAKALDLLMIDFLVISGRGGSWLSHSQASPQLQDHVPQPTSRLNALPHQLGRSLTLTESHTDPARSSGCRSRR